MSVATFRRKRKDAISSFFGLTATGRVSPQFFSTLLFSPADKFAGMQCTARCCTTNWVQVAVALLLIILNNKKRLIKSYECLDFIQPIKCTIQSLFI